MKKRLLACLLVCVMVLGNVLFSSAQISGEDIEEAFLEKNNLSEMQLERNLSETEEVRIIVELDKQPVLDVYDSYNMAYAKTLDAEQQVMKQSIQEMDINVEYHQTFTSVANGFSATTTLAEAKKIEGLPGVRRVLLANEYERPEPKMWDSGDYIGKNEAIQAYQGKYNGEGIVVAIIDSGIDYTHKDMRLSDPSKAKLKENASMLANDGMVEFSVQDIINDSMAAKPLKGKFYTEKVPYGYNYMDHNQEIRDLGSSASMHGMHVAGTVAANTEDEDTGVTGIAPEAQLLALKVFGNNPLYGSAYGDVIVAAIDDAIEMKADVINMSLGAPRGFVDEQEFEQMAVKRAVDAGVSCSIAAGNETYTGDGVQNAINMDNSIVGTPSVTLEAMSVAALDNKRDHAKVIKTKSGLEIPCRFNGPRLPYIDLGTDFIEYVPAGIGKMEDVKKVDLLGKIALIKRGELSFYDKIMNAYSQGAIAVIIYNHESGGESPIGMAGVEEVRIPAIGIGVTDGKKLVAQAEKMLAFTDEDVIKNVLTAGEMSDFTSWGPVSTLDLKPEITAPGGHIYSTFNEDQYGMMGGTSMAAPHVAGVMALVYQRLNEEFPELAGAEKVQFAKNLLMSSAEAHKPPQGIYDMLGTYTPPRQQGAGVVNIYKALSSQVIFTEPTTGETEVDLLEVDNDVEFQVKLTNYSDADIEGTLKNVVQVPYTYQKVVDDKIIGFLQDFDSLVYSTVADDNGFPTPISMTTDGQQFSKDQGLDVVVPANGSLTLDIKMDLKNAVINHGFNLKSLKDAYENGCYLEGFLFLEEKNSEDPVRLASIPFLGYYGEWDLIPIMDGSVFDNHPVHKGYTGLYSNEGKALHVDSEGRRIVGNPTNNFSNKGVALVFTTLRNAVNLKTTILNEDKEVIRILNEVDSLPKTYGKDFYFFSDFEWDLKVNGEVVPEGQYYMQVEAAIDFEGAETQVYQYPFYVDHSQSTIDNVVINPLTNLLEIEGTPEGTGINSYGFACINVALPTTPIEWIENETGSFDISEMKEQLFNGVFELIPYVRSMNGSIDIGSSLGQLAVNPDLIDEVVKAEFNETLAFNYAKDTAVELAATLSTSVYKEAVLAGTNAKATYQFDGDIRRVVYYDYDNSLIKFEDNSKLSPIGEDALGATRVKALYVANNDLLEDLVGPVQAVTTTSGAIGLTEEELVEYEAIHSTPGVFKFVDNPDEHTGSYVEGLDYFFINTAVKVVNTPEPSGVTENDLYPPYVKVTSFEYDAELTGSEMQFYNGKIIVQGTLLDDSKVVEFKVNGEDITDQLTYNVDTRLYEFAVLADVQGQGYNYVNLYAKDATGKDVELAHRFFLDKEAPLLEINNGKIVVENNKPFYQFDMKVADMTPSYTVTVNGDLLFSHYENYGEYAEYLGVAKNTFTKTYKLPAKEGANKFNFVVQDGVGHVTQVEKEITYTKPDDGGSSGGGGGSTGGSTSSGSTSSSTTTKNISKQSVANAIKKAKDEPVVEIDTKVSSLKNAKAKLDASVLEELSKADKNLSIKMKDVSVQISPESLVVPKGKKVELTVKETKSKEKNAASKTYDFSFSGAKGINNFKQPVRITLPVDKTTKVDKNQGLAIYYYNQDAKKWEAVGGFYNKKDQTVTAAVSHFSKYQVMTSRASFGDVKSGFWGKDAIEALASKGIINGKGNGQFDPQGQLTYAEFTKMLVEVLGLPVEEMDGKWYESYMKVALENEIITVTQKVKANEPISREEMAIMIARVIKGYKVLPPKYELPKGDIFGDTATLSKDSQESINLVASEGLLNGRADKVFAPEGTLTRAEAAAVIFRLLETMYK